MHGMTVMSAAILAQACSAQALPRGVKCRSHLGLRVCRPFPPIPALRGARRAPRTTLVSACEVIHSLCAEGLLVRRGDGEQKAPGQRQGRHEDPCRQRFASHGRDTSIRRMSARALRLMSLQRLRCPFASSGSGAQPLRQHLHDARAPARSMEEWQHGVSLKYVVSLAGCFQPHGNLGAPLLAARRAHHTSCRVGSGARPEFRDFIGPEVQAGGWIVWREEGESAGGDDGAHFSMLRGCPEAVVC